MQANGEAWKLVKGKPLSVTFGNVKITTVAGANMFLGLAITDTSIFDGSGYLTLTDGIGFFWNGTALYYTAVKNGSASATNGISTPAGGSGSTGIVFTSATNIYKLVFEWDGINTIKFYIQETEASVMKLVGTVTDGAATITKYPDDETLTKTIALQNISASTAQSAYVDYFDVFMAR
jgi:hypothetical protein